MIVKQSGINRSVFQQSSVQRRTPDTNHVSVQLSNARPPLSQSLQPIWEKCCAALSWRSGVCGAGSETSWCRKRLTCKRLPFAVRCFSSRDGCVVRIGIRPEECYSLQTIPRHGGLAPPHTASPAQNPPVAAPSVSALSS